MDFANSITSAVKSIAWVSLFLFAYTLIEVPFDIDVGADYLDIVLLFLVFYIVFSIAGWLLIGFPVHLAINKWGNKNYYLYPAIAFLFMVLVFVFSNLEAALVYGLSAVFQASIFSYYVFKSEHNKRFKKVS